jgi:hypothetical protein
MRQLVGTLVVFSLISCAAASDVLDREGAASQATTMAEVTIEGSPKTSEEIAHARGKALETTKVALAAPYLDVRAIDVASDGSGSTMIEVRTADGWHRLPNELLAYYEDDPGCPSIERESSIDEIRVEQGNLVIVTSSDREWYDEAHAGPLVTQKARACRESVEGWICGEPTIVSATLELRSLDEELATAPAIKRSYESKYWVNADGEIETDRPFDEVTLAGAEPGT